MKHLAGSISRPIPRKLALLVAAALATTAAAAEAPPGRALSALPISFERNDGQFRPDILFLARGVAGEVAVRYGDIAITPSRPLRREGRKLLPPESAGKAFGVRLSGANPAPEIEARDPRVTLGHHYEGTSRWENVPHYGSVVMRNVYTDIDLAVHGAQGALEYDFIVSPGAQPSDIRLRLDADSVTLDAQGNLVLEAGGEVLRQHAPIAYQQRGEERIPVAARFELHGEGALAEASFVLGEYDASLPLVIDPVIGYSTYLGASGDEYGGFVKVDNSGNVFVAYTSSTSGIFSASAAVNVTKFNPATNTHLFTTTLNGSSYEVVNALALGVGASGGVASFITGYTNSPNFPHCIGGSGAHDCAPYGGLEDAFVSGLEANGALTFSRLLGGSGNEAGADITVSAGVIYVTGDTDEDFPTTAGALYPNKIGGSGSFDSDAFVAKLDQTGSLLYSTYLGGSGFDVGTAITVDGAGNMFLGGHSHGPDFPTVNAFDSSGPGAYVAGLNAAGNTLLFSTYLGGSGTDDVRAIVRDSATGDLMVLGDTSYASFPLVNPIQGYSGGRDVFLTRINFTVGASGATIPHIAFSTYLGGSGDDYAGGLAQRLLGASGASGEYWVSGGTSSGNFPMVAQIQPALSGPSDAFVARIQNDQLTFSTYLGGSGAEMGNSAALGASGSIWIGGRTASNDYPVVTPFKAAKTGVADVFVTRLDSPVAIAAAKRFEWNTDGHPDIIYRNAASGATYVWRMNGPAFLGDQYVTTIDPSWSLIGHGDFDGDGKNDMVWRNDATGSAYVWYMKDGVYQSDAFLFTIDPIWKVEAVADFNRDGKPDFLFRHQSTGVGFIWYYNNTTPVSDQFLFSIDNSWIVENVGDFDGDGYPDFFFRNTRSGVGFVWYWDGTALGRSNYMFGIDPIWEVVEIADWNGDGIVDLLFRNRDTGLVFVWYTNGTSLQGSDFVTQIDPSWKIAPYR